jgi:hypothetical protein
MPQLSEAHKFYITHHRDMDVKTLARKLKVTMGMVTNYLNYLKGLDTQAANEAEKQHEIDRLTHTQETKGPRTDDLMIKNKKRGVVVMTAEASQIGDATRKKTINPRIAENVHIIRPEREETV